MGPVATPTRRPLPGRFNGEHGLPPLRMMAGHEIVAACWLAYDGVSVGDEAREVEGGVADQGERVQADAAVSAPPEGGGRWPGATR